MLTYNTIDRDDSPSRWKGRTLRIKESYFELFTVFAPEESNLTRANELFDAVLAQEFLQRVDLSRIPAT
jgi:hypothetical protein